MKTLKRLSSMLLAVLMVMAMAIPAFAQDVTVGETTGGSITISNAAKGETYTIYKLFDATVTGTKGGSIAYTGDIPTGLTDYFTKDSVGNISEKAAARNESKEMSDGLRDALKTWTVTATATASAESDGSTLTFKNLPYGYYVVTTTQGEQTITVDSTNPNAKIVDKNGTVPSDLSKTVNDDDVNFGDTVTYTVTFNTSNYDGNGTAAKKIMSYTIEDTLPDFLSNVTVTSIIVDNDGSAETTNDRANVTDQFNNKKIVLDWYDETNSKFLYDNGATVTLTYTAVVTDKAKIDGNGNTNTVTVKWTDENVEGLQGNLTDSETIYTYAIALKKVNDKGEALSGAKFELPFYVKTTPDSNGAYIYAGTSAGEGLTNQLTTPESGEITIKGVETGTYSITEVEAPNGYNKLTAPVSISAVQTGANTTASTAYLNENGEVVTNETATTVEYNNDKLAAAVIFVVNKSGAELPSTGGMGTTIFYIAGTVLVLGAGVILVTRRRMSR